MDFPAGSRIACHGLKTLSASSRIPLSELLDEVRSCRLCEAHLPLGPRPVVRAAKSSRLLIIGQAPGTKVHASGIPWDDASGDRLRAWMGVDKTLFYDEKKIAIIPMGFCYPGRGKGGDLPPRPECAPTWHQQLLDHLPNIRLTLLIGSYAQRYYLPQTGKMTLTDRVRNHAAFGPGILPLVHPSPRNTLWLKRNPWFEAELVSELQRKIRSLVSTDT